MLPVLAEHHCARRHASTAVLLRCRLRDIGPINGSGRLALLIRCNGTRAELFERLEHARSVAAELDVFGCGPLCTRQHELVAVDLDGTVDLPATPPSVAVRRAEERALKTVRQEHG